MRGSVYPRWRGEHYSIHSNHSEEDGLSPLARGTRYQPYLIFDRSRFIPAGAGNTSRITESNTEPPVYPRWRGEHWLERYEVILERGLSPLARGTH